jgi:ectoine hydroxylase-related dioxygenase (phytanoyl-CoA dioxygenase family)
VDFKGDADGWTMVGFIFMVDEFRSDNGATRFVPGSHKWSTVPSDLMNDPLADYEGQIQACGPAGANLTDKPRRSIQGAYIRREAPSGIDLPARMRPDTMARISPLAKYILAV